MRIFYAAADTPNYWNLPSSRLWYANLYLPLEDLGHDLVTFDYDYGAHNDYTDERNPAHKAFMDANRPRVGDALVRQVAEAHSRKRIDLFFSYFYSAYVHPDAI